MKTNLTIILMVFISLAGQAQKPKKGPGLNRDYSNARLKNHSPFQTGSLEQIKSENLHESFLAKKQIALKHLKSVYEKTKRLEYNNTPKLKSGLASFSEQMDSIIDYRWNNQTLSWEIFYMEWMEYDSLGNNTLDAWLGADGPIFPDYGGKWEVKWDDMSRMIEDIDYDWDFQTRNYVPYEKGRYEYDVNGYPAVTNREFWNQTLQTWEPYYTDTFSIDASGNLLNIISYEYDTIISDWAPIFWLESETDSTGVRNKESQYFWDIDSNDWFLSGYTEYFVDEKGRDTVSNSYYWNGAWYEESQRKEIKFDASDNIIMEADLWWDGESDWLGNQKYDFTHNAAGSITEEIISYWDYFWWDWYVHGKITYAHDGNGNLIEEASYYYDTASMTFIPDWKILYEFDLGANFLDIAIPLEIEEDVAGNPRLPVNNKVLKYTELVYNPTLSKWDSSEIEIFHYSPFGTMAPIQCKADFSFTPDEDPLLINFSDASGIDVTSWYWDFGDGTSSTQKNPKHTYRAPGTYKVSLSTIDATGKCTNTVSKQIAVGNALCRAEFRMTVDTVGMTVNLVNSSQGTGLSYFWNFGDGEGSKLMSPSHTYSYSGNYTISLTVQNSPGTCMDRYSMSTGVGTGLCKADFDVFVDSITRTATFKAAKLNPDNLYRWEFGDGSYEKTPMVTKTFTHPGYYSATLKVSNAQAGCVNTETKTILIGKKNPGGKAGFIYMSGNEAKVRFSDRSLGDNLKYYWNFGGTDTSTLQNPTHDFVLPGYYSVCLTVFTPDGERNTHCEKVFAGEDTKDECLARFEYRLTENERGISCLDRSLGNPDQWKWTYDDGWSTTQQNPSWSTGSPRYLKLQQTIRNSTTGCRDDAVAIINMGADAAVKAGFGFVIDTSSTKAETYPVDFIGVSLGDAGKLKWSFGDGTFDSTAINPVHHYAIPGTYEVCLTVTNTTTGEEDTSCEMVTVGSATSTNNFSGLSVGLKSYPNPFSEKTKIEIQLTEDTGIDLSVFDLMGRKVKTVVKEHRAAGSHIFNLEGSDMETGHYYLILETGYGKSRSVLSIIR